MLTVDKNNTIHLTRGDTADLYVSITNGYDNSEYTPTSSDTLKLTVRKSVEDSTIIIQKTITGSNSIHISPSDTSSLSFGTYVYDVELTIDDDEEDEVYTIIPVRPFELLSEVTY